MSSVVLAITHGGVPLLPLTCKGLLDAGRYLQWKASFVRLLGDHGLSRLRYCEQVRHKQDLLLGNALLRRALPYTWCSTSLSPDTNNVYSMMRVMEQRFEHERNERASRLRGCISKLRWDTPEACLRSVYLYTHYAREMDQMDVCPFSRTSRLMYMREMLGRDLRLYHYISMAMQESVPYEEILSEIRIHLTSKAMVLGETREHSSADGPCAICQYEEEESHWSKLACGHLFHVQCIAGWLNRKNTCPLCRHQVTRECREE